MDTYVVLRQLQDNQLANIKALHIYFVISKHLNKIKKNIVSSNSSISSEIVLNLYFSMFLKNRVGVQINIQKNTSV